MVKRKRKAINVTLDPSLVERAKSAGQHRGEVELSRILDEGLRLYASKYGKPTEKKSDLLLDNHA